MTITINVMKGQLSCEDLNSPVRIGKAGYVPANAGREGDAKTPLGQYVLRFGFYRADRLPRPPKNPIHNTPLVFHPLDPNDGWCDESSDPAYNRFVRLPYAASIEALWREDGAYDIILVMSHNDSPPVPDLGSAVFIHIAQADDRQTLGCVALAPEDMTRLLPKLYCGQILNITA